MVFALSRHAVTQEAQNIGIRGTQAQGDCADEGTSRLGEWFSVEIQASVVRPTLLYI